MAKCIELYDYFYALCTSLSKCSVSNARSSSLLSLWSPFFLRMTSTRSEVKAEANWRLLW